jgi:hypothetical protein
MHMRLHIWIKSSLIFRQIQFLYQTCLFQDLNGFINSCKTDNRIDLFDFAVDSLSRWMSMIVENESADRYYLGCNLLSFSAQSFDYR